MKFATLLIFGATAYGLAFDGPLPTPVTDLVYAALTGFSPKPTDEARALPDIFRRQKAASNPGVCGYLDGDAGMSAPFEITPSIQLRPQHMSPFYTMGPYNHTQNIKNNSSALSLYRKSGPIDHIQKHVLTILFRVPSILHLRILLRLLLVSKMVRLLRRLQQLRSYDPLYKLRFSIILSWRRILLQRPHGHGM
jgi:hypothetical protein